MHLHCNKCNHRLTKSLFPSNWKTKPKYRDLVDGDVWQDTERYIPRGGFIYSKGYGYSWTPDDSGIKDMHYKIHRPAMFRIDESQLLEDVLPPWDGRNGCCDYSGHMIDCPSCGQKDLIQANLDCYMDKHIVLFEDKVKRSYG